jgi:ATP-dependent exoDNAse (exonuclease V) beta subunit
VRILTVHGAKGLEFPITILSGLTTALARRPNGVQVLFPGAARWAVKLKKGLDTEDFKSAIPVEEQMDEHERLRLLYVAATRARDHLVVSVHRKHGAKPDATAAGLLHRAGWDETLVEVLDFGAAEPNPPLATSAVPVTAALPSLAEWESARAAALASGTRRLATSATQLAEAAARARDDVGLRKDPRDIDLPPWQKGRYGTAVGRAVHGVLQTVDLASGAGLADAAAAQAAAEGVLGREGVIASLCRSALASDIVQRAAARQHWREVYVGVPYGDAVLEGYIDLLYRDDDGLVVVDYKTDAWETEADLAGKVERYRVQLDAYALAVETVLDEKVVRSELLFLATTGDAHAVVL